MKNKKIDYPEIVMICWIEKFDTELPEISTVAYHSGSGSPRVYVKDAYDGRFDLGSTPDQKLSYFDNANSAFRYMILNKGHQFACQVNICVVHELGWKPLEFDLDDLSRFGLYTNKTRILHRK